MNLPEWLQEVLDRYDRRTEPFMEVSVGQDIRGARPPGDLNDDDWRAFLAEDSAFMFHERRNSDSPWGTYFAPMFEGTMEDGSSFQSPDIQKLDGETVNHWAERVERVHNPVMRARYADCVWDLEPVIVKGIRPRHQFARLAAAAYVESISAKLYFHEFDGIEWLSRSLSLARSVNDQELSIKVAQAFLDFCDTHCNPAHVGIWLSPFDRLYGEKGLLTVEQQAKVIADLEQMLILTSNPDGGHFDPFGAQAAAERLIAHYKDTKQSQRLVLTYGAAFERLSKDADAMLAMAWLQPVIERYEQMGLKSESERLARFAAEKGLETPKSLKTYSAEMSIPAETVESYATSILGDGDLEGALFRLADFFKPDPQSAMDTLLQAKKDAPFQSLIQIKVTRMDGQTEAIIGSVDDDLEGRLQKQISDMLMMTNGLLVYMMSSVLAETHATPGAICDILHQSPVFVERRREFILQGMKAHMEGDYMKSIHVLVPQVEEIVRNLLALIRVPIYKNVKEQPGVVDVKSMGEVLRDERLKTALPEYLWRYMTVLYTDRRGINLRNHLAHGQMSIEALNIAVSSRVIHSLLCLSRLRISEIPLAENKPLARPGHNASGL